MVMTMLMVQIPRTVVLDQVDHPLPISIDTWPWPPGSSQSNDGSEVRPFVTLDLANLDLASKNLLFDSELILNRMPILQACLELDRDLGGL